MDKTKHKDDLIRKYIKLLLFYSNKICTVFFGKSFFYLNKFYKKYGIIGIIGLIIFIFTSYTAFIIYVLGYFKGLLLGQYYDDYRNLDNIKLQYQLDYVIDIFGKPAIKNSVSYGFVENVFVKEGYILQAVTDDQKKIVGIGITCLDKSFNYKIGGITLCKSNFTDIPQYNIFNEARGVLGSKHMEYYESYGGDGVSGYKFFTFGLNSLGYLDNGDYIDDKLNNEANIKYAEKRKLNTEYMRNFRKDNKINTYFVSDRISNGVLEMNERSRFGVDYYQLHFLTNTNP